MRIIFCIVVTAVSLLTGCSPGNPADVDGLQGTWKPVAAELGGKRMPDAVLRSISLKLDGDRYEVFADGTPDRGTYLVDRTSQPKTMTISGTEGPNKGKSFPCIYELEGDTMRICYDLSGAKRPTEFNSPTGTKVFLVTYARKKQ